MKIAVVIVTYNRVEKLKLSIDKTMKEEIDFCVVVDNNSSDGTMEWLNSIKDSRLIVLRMDKNIGGAGGFHEGFKYVINHTDADWIVCYDDDAFPSSGVLKKFRNFEKKIDKKTASVASAIYLPDGRISEMNRPSYNPFWSLSRFIKTIYEGRMGFHVEDDVYKSMKPMYIDSSSFVGYFIRTQVVKEVGLPPKECFLYGDDIIYMLRVRKKGFRHLFNPELIFFHDCETLVQQKQIYRPLWKAYYTYRNGIRIYKEAGSAIGLLFVLPVKLISWLKQSKYYEDKKLYKKLVFIAVLDGIRGNFDKKHEEIVKLFGL